MFGASRTLTILTVPVRAQSSSDRNVIMKTTLSSLDKLVSNPYINRTNQFVNMISISDEQFYIDWTKKIPVKVGQTSPYIGPRTPRIAK